MHGVEVQVFSGLNGRVQIEDQISILETLQANEKVLLFEQGLEQYAINRAKEVVPVLTKEYGVEEEECRRLFFA